MKREQILRLWRKADVCKDMDKANEIYNSILQLDELKDCLSPKEVGDIFYNCALNNTEIAQYYFENRLYTRAHTHTEQALSNARVAHRLYNSNSSRTDVLTSEKLIKKYQANLTMIEEILQQRAAVIPECIHFFRPSGSPKGKASDFVLVSSEKDKPMEDGDIHAAQKPNSC
jgi:hypothetical protein